MHEYVLTFDTKTILKLIVTNNKYILRAGSYVSREARRERSGDPKTEK